MDKIYVIDTNVLLQDPNSIYSFEKHEIVIPAVVLEEVDSKKRNMDEIGRNAREVSRIMDKLRVQGKLHDGVKLISGGTLRVELNHKSFSKLEDAFVERTNDNRILAVALNLHLEEKEKGSEKEVTLVSKDMLMRIKADSIGLIAEDFLSERAVNEDAIYNGFKELYVSEDEINLFFQTGELDLQQQVAEALHPNEFIILKNRTNPSHSAIGMVRNQEGLLQKCRFQNEQAWGIRPRNAQQVMALELLLRRDIPLVTIAGKAGTGKTLLALAAGLMQIEDFGFYKKLLVARPVVPMGKDIGYLPGEKEEKLRPWMQPIYDNLEYLFDVKKPGELDEILSGIGSIQVEALTYIRGRSIPEQLILIDEAQNLTKHEVKTILTRIGEGSKIVLLGDPHQIDHPYLDEYNNGLIHVVEKFKDQKLSGHVKLVKGERSPLAQLAADFL
ncbi:AAA family ATPase [Pontibacillus yanchengensis]|uniref:AAA family ATPase n=2 Tax=Pontibacillus yanchengensis TaxID=462910 RepID=A0A6I4ZS03_9BACI|nr:PhoH family protein [Pontibacillus yanchengensis]MYL32995.1 AAA family ATPase [Pontibacillus yanchengensis]MYL52155.1 AAA family ATPase [Pontibacillus yanchengensis]